MHDHSCGQMEMSWPLSLEERYVGLILANNPKMSPKTVVKRAKAVVVEMRCADEAERVAREKEHKRKQAKRDAKVLKYKAALDKNQKISKLHKAKQASYRALKKARESKNSTVNKLDKLEGDHIRKDNELSTAVIAFRNAFSKRNKIDWQVLSAREPMWASTD